MSNYIGNAFSLQMVDSRLLNAFTNPSLVFVTDVDGKVYTVECLEGCYFQGLMHCPVIAWMPLPEPYKEKANE